ncbi:MAG: SBBP repeat-containing protein [Chitinophagaceae bacterium]|jgi:hypothetical protein
MKKLFFFLLTFCWISLSHAYYYKLDWANSIGGKGNNVGTSLVVDADGNVYTCGYFSGTADFDPGPGVFNLTSLGSLDIFITKYDGSGNFKWAKSCGGPDNEFVTGITIGITGNILTVGNFRNTVDFDPGPGMFSMTSAGGSDIFILSLDSIGRFQWAKQFSGSMEQSGSSIITDIAGNIYTTGSFSGPTDFDPGVGVYSLNTTTGTGPGDAFVLKLNSTGDFIWAKQFTGTASKGGVSVKVDKRQNVYSTGSFQSTVDFDPGSGIYNLKSAGNNDIYVSKLDSSGNFLWAGQIGGKGSDGGASCALDSMNNLFVTGNFAGTVDFDPDFIKSHTITSTLQGTFILKLDSAGKFKWVKKFEGFSGGTSITLDPDENIYTTGSFRGDADFDPGPGKYDLHVKGGGATDIFISRLNPAGDFVWAQSFGSTQYDDGRSIVADGWGHIYLAGDFGDSVDFDPSKDTMYRRANGTTDAFVLKMQECFDYNLNFIKRTCKPYLFNSKLLTTSGLYTEVFTSLSGCDSTVTVDLDITPVNAVITSYGLTMGVGTVLGATYQWVECPSYTAIPGANSRIYAAPAKGSYSIIITLGDCSDTADCYSPTPLSIESYTGNQSVVSITPNPSTGTIRVLSTGMKNARLNITNMMGSLMLTDDLLTGDDQFDISTFPSGIYLVKILDDEQHQHIQTLLRQ